MQSLADFCILRSTKSCFFILVMSFCSLSALFWLISSQFWWTNDCVTVWCRFKRLDNVNLLQLQLWQPPPLDGSHSLLCWLDVDSCNCEKTTGTSVSAWSNIGWTVRGLLISAVSVWSERHAVYLTVRGEKNKVSLWKEKIKTLGKWIGWSNNGRFKLLDMSMYKRKNGKGIFLYIFLALTSCGLSLL